jgi:large subunit ribosomal protein L23
MALFNRNKKAPAPAKDTPKKEAVAVAPRAASASTPKFSHLLKAPRITEKAAIGTDNGVYVFNVQMNATKPMVARAIIELFKVKPRKIRMTHIPAVRVKTRQTQKVGFTNRGKKAYVYLNKGDKIDLA